MSTGTDEWRATIGICPPSDRRTERLARALAPEAGREVPRARAELSRPAPGELRLDIRARDAGALRAALNTFLGWIALADETENVAEIP